MELSDNCIFFFQAEDGIRDYKVTGVQTCALPISAVGAHLQVVEEGAARREPTREVVALQQLTALHVESEQARQIGRASCRERVESCAGTGAQNKKKCRGKSTQ